MVHCSAVATLTAGFLQRFRFGESDSRVGVLHARRCTRVADWDLAPIAPRGARVAGALSLVIWAVVIVCGRMIAYDWFDCDKAQSPIVVRAAGCDGYQR